MSVSVAGIPKNRCRTTVAERMVETRAELPFTGDQVGLFRARPGRPKRTRRLASSGTEPDAVLIAAGMCRLVAILVQVKRHRWAGAGLASCPIFANLPANGWRRWSSRYPKRSKRVGRARGGPPPSVTAELFLMITLPECLWCRRPFRPRRGGSPKRFCCAAHRIAFWSAARRWAEKAVASGVLSVGDIRNGVGEACTPLPGAGSPAPVPLPQKSATVAPGERPDEPGELPDDP